MENNENKYPPDPPAIVTLAVFFLFGILVWFFISKNADTMPVRTKGHSQQYEDIKLKEYLAVPLKERIKNL